MDMISLEKFAWPMEELPTSDDVLHCQALHQGLCPITLCVLREKKLNDGGHVEPELIEENKPNDQGKKLVELNLACQEGESSPIFMSANLPV